MTELKHKLKEKFKIELSRFHINRIISDNNITLKIREYDMNVLDFL